MTPEIRHGDLLEYAGVNVLDQALWDDEDETWYVVDYPRMGATAVFTDELRAEVTGVWRKVD